MTATAARLPNFFLAGVPKAGTTSLYFYLAQHPQVYMSPIKEPTFFGAADIQADPQLSLILRRAVRDRGPLHLYLQGTHADGPLVLEWDNYLKLFRNAHEEIAIGEASVSYFWQPSAASAIRAQIPGGRLIFILRDPAERLFSHYYLGTWWHHPGETFRTRFMAAMEPGHVGRRMVEIGRYATHLQRFFQLFPRNQICIQLYDDYRADPRAVVRNVLTFLSVDPDHPVDLSRRHGETAVPRFPALHALRHRIFGGAPVARWLPEGARRVLRRLYRREPDMVLEPADRRLVIEYYRDEILRTGDLIGRDLSAWLR
jgi:hypothetical protein